MIQVQFMKPFFTKFTGEKLKVVFAYQYLSITKDDKVFQFIPIEGKEIEINAKTRQVTNLSDVFVFQYGNQFIRLPLYQLLLVSNIFEHLNPIIDGNIPKKSLAALKANKDVENEDIKIFIQALEQANLLTLIDRTLDTGDETGFYKLTALLHQNYGNEKTGETD